ncbi:MAG: SRPBCC domain-containing protein [Microthrixaceae bacterium]
MTDGSRVLVSIRIKAPVDRVFEAFTTEIDHWWRPNQLFPFTPGPSGVLSFEVEPYRRLVETSSSGTVFEIGRIKLWEPPHRLVATWTESTFAEDQETELRVSFEPVGTETRVTVEHVGWDSIPRDHLARHGFELMVFQRRLAEWWRELLDSLRGKVVPTGWQG